MDLEQIEKANEPSLGPALFHMYEEGEACFDGIISSEANRAALVDHIAGEVQENLSDLLKKKCYFEIDKVVEMTIERLLEGSGTGSEEGMPMDVLVYGKTQSGKSAFKAVVVAVCSFMRVPVVVITKDKSESGELFAKLVRFFKGTSTEGNIFSPYITRELDIQDHFNNGDGGAIVIPDSTVASGRNCGISNSRGSVLYLSSAASRGLRAAKS